MRVKQVLTGILATAILCSLAAGCGEQQTVSTNSASADMAASSLAVSAEGSVAPTADVAAMETSEVASTKDVEHTFSRWRKRSPSAFGLPIRPLESYRRTI